jgi:hypothetical protein
VGSIGGQKLPDMGTGYKLKYLLPPSSRGRTLVVGDSSKGVRHEARNVMGLLNKLFGTTPKRQPGENPTQDRATSALRQIELARELMHKVEEAFQQAKNAGIIRDPNRGNSKSSPNSTSPQGGETFHPGQVAELVAQSMTKSFSGDRFSQLLSGQTLAEGWTKESALAMWSLLRNLPVQIAAFSIYNDWNKVSCLTIGGRTNTGEVDRFVNCGSARDIFRFFTQYADRMLGRPETSEASMRAPDLFLDPIPVASLCVQFVDVSVLTKALLEKLTIDWSSLESNRDGFSEPDRPQSPRASSQLGEEEELCLLVTFFVSGRWQEMAGTEEESREFVLEFVRSLKQDRDHAVMRSIFLKMQQALMAHPGKWSFERIQEEPPFSEFAQENALRLHNAWLGAGDNGFRDEWKRIFTSDWKARAATQNVVTVQGGPGQSAETAIVLNAPDVQTRVAAEHWYLYYTYGREWRLEVQKLVGPHDVMQITLPNGGRKDVFFDRKCGNPQGSAPEP